MEVSPSTSSSRRYDKFDHPIKGTPDKAIENPKVERYFQL